MNVSELLPTFVITLREGVEAALVVGIVLACLRRAKQSQLAIWVWLAVLAGVGVSGLIGLLFGWLIQALGTASPIAEPLLEAVFSGVAIVLLSWMLIWMTHQARSLKSQVEGAVNAALHQQPLHHQHLGSAGVIFGLVFVAVLREGFETVVFVIAKFQQGMLPALGSLAGLLAAAGVGLLLFKWGIKLNLKQFFQVMGVVLLLVVSGLVVTALGHVDTVMATLANQSRATEGLCFYYERFTRVHSCVLGAQVWNLSQVLPDDRFPGLVLSALFGYTQRLYAVQAVAYTVFLITIGSIYFQSLAGRVFFIRKPASLPNQ